ncbi:MAG: orotate phosphoribosyltransferase [Gemmatimonadales bacterium]
MTATTNTEARARLIELLSQRSVIRGDFVLASGNRSSYYIDARRTTMSGQGQSLIGPLGLATLRAHGWTPRAVGGLTLGADPIAYAIVHTASLSGDPLNAFTVRKEAKTHGTGRRIEGCFDPGDAVVVIEDVLTTGHSALDAIAVVRAAGGQVLGVLTVVDREAGGRRAVEATGVPVAVLVTVSELGV